MANRQPEPEKIDNVLNSLDGIQRVKAPAFFYTRLKARMEREMDNGGTLIRLLTRPALALSIAIAILVLNATVIFNSFEQDKPAISTDTPQLVAAEYPLSTYPVYDENTVEP